MVRKSRGSMSDNSGGSCEPCKRKKCKCDRKLPECSNCIGTSFKCLYAEGNKRGIPTGYLGTLEQRLTETENALSSVLRVLQDSGISTTLLDELLAQSESTTASGPETNINKTARMIEWKRYPLQSNKELLEWRRFFSNSLPTTPPNEHRSSHNATNPVSLVDSTEVAHAQDTTTESLWQQNNLLQSTEMPLVDRFESRVLSDSIDSGGGYDIQLQTSPSAQTSFVPSQKASGVPEQYPKLKEIPRMATSVETSRPDALEQRTNAVTELSASQHLATTRRNKYY